MIRDGWTSTGKLVCLWLGQERQGQGGKNLFRETELSQKTLDTVTNTRAYSRGPGLGSKR